LVLKQQLPKDKAIRISDQWDNEVLSEDQVSYAARDAYVSLQIYKKLKVLTELGSVPENAPPGFLVDIYQNDCQKLIATGAWVSVVSDSTSMCTVEVKKIHVPAAIIEHHQCALSTFGPPPFKITCRWKQIHPASMEDIQVAEMSSSLQGETESTTEVSDNSDLPEKTIENIPNDESSWLADVDDGLVMESNSKTPTASDETSKNTGERILVELQNETLEKHVAGKETGSGIPSRVLKDAWHAFDMLTISKSHGLRKEFARALRDALFIVNPSDKAKVDARLKSEGSSWEEKLKYHPKSLWPLVRRTIPPPKYLYKIVEALFKTYGPLKDATTGQPLFTAATWKSAKSILKLIEAGYLSDPPGIPLYYEVGRDRKENGLPVWHCMRGTNTTEGGVHHSIRAAFPDSCISARHADNLLSIFQLHHNITVGTRNSTGKEYDGHFDIWMIDQLQILAERMRDKVPRSFEIRGWINGSMYAPTKEVSGILPIPEEIRFKSAMQPVIPEPPVKKGHWYLALCQNTKYAVMSIHTVAEKQLFSKLMREHPAFNQENQDPDWKKAVVVWNGNHAKGNENEIFYKVCSLV